MNHSQQLELSLGKRTELICTPNNMIRIIWFVHFQPEIFFNVKLNVYDLSRHI